MSKTKGKPNKMRKTDVLCQNKFNGDINKTIEYILWNYEYDKLDSYVVEWSPKESRIAYRMIKKKGKAKLKETTANKTRKTDELCRDKFNGDVYETIKYILLNYEDEEFQSFVFEWTRKEIKIAKSIIKNDADVNSLYEKARNPFVLELIISIVLLIVGCALLLLIGKYIVAIRGAIRYIGSVFIGLMALRIARCITNLFAFRKLQANKFYKNYKK